MNERAIFEAALDRKDPEQRSAYLNDVCGADQALRQQIEGLLKAHEMLGSFLASPPPALATTLDEPITERPGSVIGPYKLMEQIGEGGMGLVFVAEQQQPLRRRVALKVIKPGLDTRQVIARFESERQALALMDHENIAKVLDAGATASGRPYFVMELVKGMPITDYCDQNQLTPRARLELFLPVCAAVQHAHQKGIIHRDLKPSNVLVASHDGTPVVKIIDFGVAKAVGQHLTDKTVYTQFAQLLGTPLYMSPEQAGQSTLDIDTRTDIYALGVVLYELLTGTTPFDKERFQRAESDEIRRIIREEEPPKPSTRISTLGQAATTISTQRKIDPNRLSQSFRGELDWIVMKALEKDRNRRYETASAFAADVQHYLHDEPVQACPPSGWYLFRKFARRNKRALVTLTLLGMVLLAAMVGLVISNQLISREQQETARQRDEAQRQRHLARQAVDQMFTQVAEKWLGRSYGLQPLQQEFLRQALRFYQEFAKEQNPEPEMRLETALAYRRVAAILVKLGDNAKVEEAEEACNQAIALLEQLLAEFPDDPPCRVALADSYGTHFEALLNRRRFGDAETAARRAVQLRKALADEVPKVPIYRQQLAKDLVSLAQALHEEGQPRKAAKAVREALRLYEELPADMANTEDSRHEVCYMWGALGVYLIASGQLQQAEECHQRTFTLYEKLVADFPYEPNHQANYAEFLLDWARCLPKTRAEEAEKAIRRALGMQENVVAHHPNDRWYQTLAADCYGALVNFLITANRSQEAVEVYYRAIELQEKLAVKCPTIGYYRQGLVGCGSNLANTLRKLGRAEEAEKVEEQLRQSLDKLDAGSRNNLAWLLATHAQAALRNPTFAVELAKEAVALAPKEGNYRNTLGAAHYRAGNFKEAVAALEKSMELRKGGDSFDWFFLAMAHWQLGDRDKARSWYGKAVQWMEKNQPQNDELRRFRAEAEKLLGIKN
jgi:serine/threonine protein kinase/tetratricopeptide (TPR) repeat protein